MKNSTPELPGPKKETLEFLKKFARLYKGRQENNNQMADFPLFYGKEAAALC